MLRAAEDGPVVPVLAVDDPALQDAPASCGAAVYMPKDHFGRRALASAWAQFGGGRPC